MALALALGLLLVLAAVTPVPVLHSTLSWVGATFGRAVNQASAHVTTLLAPHYRGHDLALVHAASSVLGLGLVVLGLAVVSTARATTRGLVLATLVIALAVAGGYAPGGSGRATLWVAAVVVLLLFGAVVAFGRLVAVLATVVTGASALSALLNWRGGTTSAAARTFAGVTKVPDWRWWAVGLTVAGLVELVLAATILVRGRVR